MARRLKNQRRNILIAGIGGASLGTEIFKSLRASGHYNIFGADISPYAYGLYERDLAGTYIVSRERYISDILAICIKETVEAVIPGGGEPLSLLSRHRAPFQKRGVILAINSPEVVRICTDKTKTFAYLKRQGVAVPATKLIGSSKDLARFSYPSVVKPANIHGGSVFAYLAENAEEAKFFASYLKKKSMEPLIQEYIPESEGEYTVGVLSLPEEKIVGSIALRRLFDAKLSVSMKTPNYVLSSGYSQGVIAEFKEVRDQAEKIAKLLHSRGPLNIQGRMKKGIFYPFEINPRFSNTTYLRTMAGFNEIDIFLQYLLNDQRFSIGKIKHGYYLRSLDEKFVSRRELKS